MKTHLKHQLGYIHEKSSLVDNIHHNKKPQILRIPLLLIISSAFYSCKHQVNVTKTVPFRENSE